MSSWPTLLESNHGDLFLTVFCCVCVVVSQSFFEGQGIYVSIKIFDEVVLVAESMEAKDCVPANTNHLLPTYDSAGYNADGIMC